MNAASLILMKREDVLVSGTFGIGRTLILSLAEPDVVVSIVLSMRSKTGLAAIRPAQCTSCISSS